VDDFFWGLWNGILIGWFAAYVMQPKNNTDKKDENT
jgi:hypothetical protein